MSILMPSMCCAIALLTCSMIHLLRASLSNRVVLLNAPRYQDKKKNKQTNTGDLFMHYASTL